MVFAAVGTVCYRNGVPFAILRGISDDFNNNDYVDFMEFANLAAKRSIEIVTEFLTL